MSDVLETGPHLRKYFLSPTAARGILRRAARRGRVIPGAVREALEANRRGGGQVTVVSTLQGGGAAAQDRRGRRCGRPARAGVDDAGTAAVRRLTPLEWERLQGFPDDWTRRGADVREQSDSARYRQATANAAPVPVARNGSPGG